MNITILIVKYFYNKFIWDIINVANVQINLVKLKKINTQKHNYFRMEEVYHHINYRLHSQNNFI